MTNLFLWIRKLRLRKAKAPPWHCTVRKEQSQEERSMPGDSKGCESESSAVHPILSRKKP